MKRNTFLLLVLFAILRSVSAGETLPKETLFLEAEGFDTKGGWVVDQQYMDQMGSPVLLAHGLGRPVADASTKITFPKSGEYRVFVRTRNWVARWAPEQTPGKFELLIGGKKLPQAFGTENDNWFWQSGGTVSVGSNDLKSEITIRDTTGFDGRCDAIILTADPDFTPPEDPKELDALRRRFLGLQEDPLAAPVAPEGPFDMVVCGGGIAGICSAVSAARLGLNVALIQDRPVLGGNNSSEVRVHLMGRTHFPPYPNLGNLVYQLDPLQTGNAQPGDFYKDEKKRAVVEAEKNITLYLSTHVFAVDMGEYPEGGAGKTIRALIGKNIETNEELRFEGTLFADCTGDGTIGFLAGAEWRVGREARSQTGESLAPETSDQLVMGASTQWYTEAVKDERGNPQATEFPPLPWAVHFNEKSAQPALEGEWDWETGLNLDQVADAERIRDHALRAVYGHWAYMKNASPSDWRKKAEDRRLAWVAFIAGKRESRRIMGDVILQEQDITQRKKFDDACVVTTWTIDLHYPTDHQTEHFKDEEFRTVAKHKQIVPYAIPYRCFYSKDIANLFMAGRCISVTHVALGTVRVQRTGGMMGEVVGMAASLCKKHGTNPRGVYHDHLSELKELMTNGIAPHPESYYPSARPIGLPASYVAPKWLDEAGKNLARDAGIAVSSTHQQASYEAANINDGKHDIASNEHRWVSDKSEGPHTVDLTFKTPVNVNAIRIISGQASGVTPITDFVFQYRGPSADPNLAGDWIDIPETKTTGNDVGDFAARFPDVEAKQFRLKITATPEGLARIWELELYHLK